MNIIAASCSLDVYHERNLVRSNRDYIYEQDVVDKWRCHGKSVLHGPLH